MTFHITLKDQLSTLKLGLKASVLTPELAPPFSGKYPPREILHTPKASLTCLLLNVFC